MQRQDVDKIELSLKSPNKEFALQTALQLLEIDADAFKNLHTYHEKSWYLNYKFLLAEFTFSAHPDPKLSERLVGLARLADLKILGSDITNKFNTPYSEASRGLSELGLSKIRMNSNLDDMQQSVLSVDKKKGGVEPGFEAIHMRDLLLYIQSLYRDTKDRIRIYNECGYDRKKLYEKYKAHLPKYLIKLDYKKLKNKYVVVEKEDLLKANTIQELYEMSKFIGDAGVKLFQYSKSVHFAKKNGEAVLEVVANDIARLFMQVQEQTLYEGRYDDGELKLMLKAPWITGAQTLAPLAGGTKDDNYCVVPVKDGNEIKFISDNSIKNLAEKLPIFAIQGDRDAIGSRGQNKLRKGNDFIAIDFGHAYQNKLSCIYAMDENFHLNDPEFKNYSIFYDSKCSDYVKGLLKLAVLSGAKLSGTQIASFGNEFYKDINKLNPHEDEIIFDNYIDRFKEMAQQFKDGADPIDIKKDNIACCEKIILKLNKAKTKHVQARDQMLEKFKKYLTLDAYSIDLIECLEKISTPKEYISLRSPDGIVLLNHLRITNKSAIPRWDLQIAADKTHTLSCKFATKGLASNAYKLIYSMLPADNNIKIVIYGDKISLSFNPNYLQTACDIFSEDKIKMKLSPDDYQLYLKLQNQIIELDTLKKQSPQEMEKHNQLESFSAVCEIIENHPSIGNYISFSLNEVNHSYQLQLIEKNETAHATRCIKAFNIMLEKKFKYDEKNKIYFIPQDQLGLLNEALHTSYENFYKVSDSLASSSSMFSSSKLTSAPTSSDNKYKK